MVIPLFVQANINWLGATRLLSDASQGNGGRRVSGSEVFTVAARVSPDVKSSITKGLVTRIAKRI